MKLGSSISKIDENPISFRNPDLWSRIGPVVSECMNLYSRHKLVHRDTELNVKLVNLLARLGSLARIVARSCGEWTKSSVPPRMRSA
jgi:hypothetical protein